MHLAAVIFSGRGWATPLAGVCLVAAAILFWSYRRSTVTGWARAACVLLKSLGFAALILCLLEPLWSGQRAKPGANYFALVADNSQGMQIKDRGQTKTRGENLREILTETPNSWEENLGLNFDLRRYYFDSQLQPARDFAAMNFDGQASSLITSLRAVAERYRGQPLAGIMVFTDGNATDASSTVPDWSGLPPIYPVVIGTDDPIEDISIQNIAVAQTSFEDAPVSVQANVLATGCAGKKIVAELTELSPPGATALTKETNHNETTSSRDTAPLREILEASGSAATLAFRFQARPRAAGVAFYRLRVRLQDEMRLANAAASVEATLANNERIIVVNRGRGPYRVLYLSGRPNWEFKFLNRALAEDNQVELVAIIRIANREPKFDFRGRAGESSNPLFRGFGNKDAETERYDQPVLVRLNVRDPKELQGGFPKTAEELFAFHAVVLDDIEAQFFTPDQMVLLQRYVSERGGSLLMLGGQESLNRGHYDQTPIGRILPVYLRPPTGPTPQLSNLRFQLTREGWLQPWVRLRQSEPDERRRIEGMPRFQVLNRLSEIKPGATVLATASDPQGRAYPALIAQRFGQGRSAVLAIGDLWRWGFLSESLHKDMDKAWRQLIRWLVTDIPDRIEFSAEPGHVDPSSLALQTRLRDPAFLPLENGHVTVRVRLAVSTPALVTKTTNAPAAAIRLSTEPASSEAGVYQTSFISRETGGYLAEAIAADANGRELGRREVGWSSEPAAEEFRNLKPNRELLREIARQTGGEMIAVQGLNDLVKQLPHRRAPVTETWSYPLWHQPAFFLFALLCLAAEWGLRRWKGLA